MDQAKVYLGYLVYAAIFVAVCALLFTDAPPYVRYGLYTGLVICFLIILWELIKHRQWNMALLSLVSMVVCGGGFLVALIVGWQEAGPWKLKKVMRIYSVLVIVCLYMSTVSALDTFFHPPVEEDAKTIARKKMIEEAAKNKSKKPFNPPRR